MISSAKRSRVIAITETHVGIRVYLRFVSLIPAFDSGSPTPNNLTLNLICDRMSRLLGLAQNATSASV